MNDIKIEKKYDNVEISDESINSTILSMFCVKDIINDIDESEYLSDYNSMCDILNITDEEEVKMQDTIYNATEKFVNKYFSNKKER